MVDSHVSDIITIKSSSGDYFVNFVDDTFEPIFNDPKPKLHLIIDAKVANIYKNSLDPVLTKFESILQIESTEKSKSLEQFPQYIQHLVANKIRRDHNLVAIGGGIIQDITCFIAATILRGVSWTFVPTTLLAQADSCIGSKSSINAGTIKNILGNFLPPNQIYLNTDYLDSLAEIDLLSGIGEIIKVHIINGPNSISRLILDYDRLIKDRDCLVYYIKESLKIKKEIIEIDEFDKNIRNVMNYGHSFGHAIEAATNFAIPHGIAVTIGMDMANAIAKDLKISSKDVYNSTHSLLCKNFILHRDTKIDADKFFDAISQDKKNRDGELGLILPGHDGKPVRRFIKNDDTFKLLCKEYLLNGRY